MRRKLAWLVPILSAITLTSCVTYTAELNRAHQLYQANDYERALALFRVIEPDSSSLSGADRIRYAYLRGMTDYRLSMRADARHWLAIAGAYEKQTPGGLSEPWKERLAEAMKDLDAEVFAAPGGSATPLPLPVPAAN